MGKETREQITPTACSCGDPSMYVKYLSSIKLWMVQCPSCRTIGPAGETVPEAIELWNESRKRKGNTG